MISFIELSSGVRSLFCTISIILMVGFVVNTIQAIIQRRFAYMVESVIELFAPFFLFRVCAEVSDYYLGAELNTVAEIFARLPYIIFIIAFALLELLFAVRFQLGVKYRKSHITPSAIKEATDDMPTGFCYYNKNGHPFLTNNTMNSLAITITGKPISNGFTFADLVMADSIREIDGVVYHFSKRELEHNGELFYELLADDVTEVYEKTRELKANNDQLRQNNAKMKAYGEHINEAVRREEILKSKINIHNEMNKLLLQTANAIDIKSKEDRERVLDTWMQNTLLLCLEASENDANPLSDLYELARLIGVTVHINEEPNITSVDTMRLFVLVTEEAMTNAVKHASSKNFYINVQQSETELSVQYTNDGTSPVNELFESGGLKEIRRKIEDFGGTMEITPNPYELKIAIPIGE